MFQCFNNMPVQGAPIMQDYYVFFLNSPSPYCSLRTATASGLLWSDCTQNCEWLNEVNVRYQLAMLWLRLQWLQHPASFYTMQLPSLTISNPCAPQLAHFVSPQTTPSQSNTFWNQLLVNYGHNQLQPAETCYFCFLLLRSCSPRASYSLVT